MLSDNIRYYRKRKEMSQDELAEQLGVSRQSISLWETGQTQPTIDNIIALTRLFGITSDELLSDTPAMQQLAHYRLSDTSFTPLYMAYPKDMPLTPYAQTLFTMMSSRFRAMTAYRA